MPVDQARLPSYPLARAVRSPEFDGLWEGAAWGGAPVLEVGCFRSEGSRHRPLTRLRLLYDDVGLYGFFRVDDRYVRSVHTEPGDPVYRDSCVEAFFLPQPGVGYVNFEFNAGGAVLSSHVVDPARTPGGFRAFSPLTVCDYGKLRVRSSLPPVVDPERCDPTCWTLEFFVPFDLLCRLAGAEVPRAGTRWRANFFKCGDATSHPHWGSWSPLPERNFHLPACFGVLEFC